MLTAEQIQQNQNIIEAELSTIKRTGIDSLMKYLRDNGFYTQAASTKWHQSYRGGLAEHSLEVFKALDELNEKLELGYNQDVIILAGSMHDICKIDAYVENEDGSFSWNYKSVDNRHALKSIDLLKAFIELTDEEEASIKYHMGAYEKKEYVWDDLSEAYHDHAIAYYTHVADMRSTYGF